MMQREQFWGLAVLKVLFAVPDFFFLIGNMGGSLTSTIWAVCTVPANAPKKKPFEMFQAFDRNAKKRSPWVCTPEQCSGRNSPFATLNSLRGRQKWHGCSHSQYSDAVTGRTEPASIDNVFDTFLSHFLLHMYCSNERAQPTHWEMSNKAPSKFRDESVLARYSRVEKKK